MDDTSALATVAARLSPGPDQRSSCGLTSFSPSPNSRPAITEAANTKVRQLFHVGAGLGLMRMVFRPGSLDGNPAQSGCRRAVPQDIVLRRCRAPLPDGRTGLALCTAFCQATTIGHKFIQVFGLVEHAVRPQSPALREYFNADTVGEHHPGRWQAGTQCTAQYTQPRSRFKKNVDDDQIEFAPAGCELGQSAFLVGGMTDHLHRRQFFERRDQVLEDDWVVFYNKGMKDAAGPVQIASRAG